MRFNLVGNFFTNWHLWLLVDTPYGHGWAEKGLQAAADATKLSC